MSAMREELHQLVDQLPEDEEKLSRPVDRDLFVTAVF